MESFSAADAANLSRILPCFREFGDYGAPFSVASIVLVYNSNTIKSPLTSFSDIARTDLKGKVSTMPPTPMRTGWFCLLLPKTMAVFDEYGTGFQDSHGSKG